jgi:hypothetical protein
MLEVCLKVPYKQCGQANEAAMATLTATSITTQTLISLIKQADPKGQMHLKVINQGRLELGADPFSSSVAIDLANETLHSLGNNTTTPMTTPVSTGRVTGNYWYQLNGKQFGCASVKALLLQSLAALAAADPHLMDKLSAVKKRTKRIVAKDKYDLFDSKHLADEYSVQMQNGWWVGTNNSTHEVRAWLALAASLSPNLKFSTSIP